MDEQEQSTGQRPKYLLWAAIALAAVAGLVAILVRLRRRRLLKPPTAERLPRPPAIPPDIRGLSEAEAQARQLEGQDNLVRFEPPRSLKQIVQDNVRTIFNLSLVGIALVQLLLGLPLDALISLGVAALNIGLNVGQELLARRRLQEVELATRPQATVIREGSVRSIDPNEIVRGDVLIVGPGDQFLVDGELLTEDQIVVDESMLTGANRRVAKRLGDQVYAGSFCTSGRGAFQTQKIGQDRLVATLIADSQAAKAALTPVEQMVARVLQVMLIIVGALTVLLLLKYFHMETSATADAFISAATVIFNLAPASLFFMIFLTYVAGTADLAKIGALVHRSRSVESLANATIVCFAQAGILTGTGVEIEMVEPPSDQERLAESRIRQILGDFTRSISAANPTLRTIAETFEGNQRASREQAPFLSVYGWSAIAFDDEDLRGVYVLGEAGILEAFLPAAEQEPEEVGQEGEEQEAAQFDLRRRFSTLGRLFRRSDEAPAEVEATPEPRQQEAEPGTEPRDAKEPPQAQEDAPRPNPLRRLAQRVGRIVRRGSPAPEDGEADAEKKEPVNEIVYLFAYHPELLPLHDAEGAPQLPVEMIPLCRLHYSEQIRPAAIETIKAFSNTGVGFKIFASGAPDRVTAVLKQVGLGAGEPLSAITGPELDGLTSEQLAPAAAENTIFGHISPEQARQVVAALRAQGESVVVAGDGANDLPAMRQADLSISRRSSSQAALGVADIVLLEDSPQVLLGVLEKGQRIVNGLLDVLRLYLTQLLYLTLLIIVIALARLGFPYASKQGSIIAIATLSLPSLGLSLWALAGVPPTKRLGRLMARFVAPAAVNLSAAALVVYWYFLDRSGELAYAQLALTHMLVVSGLLLVILVRPPIRRRIGGGVRIGDWRPAVLALVVLALFFLITFIPLAYQFFLITPLEQASDYIIVFVASLAWAAATRFIWLLVPVTATRTTAEE